jgi:hypothetical protein
MVEKSVLNNFKVFSSIYPTWLLSLITCCLLLLLALPRLHHFGLSTGKDYISFNTLGHHFLKDVIITVPKATVVPYYLKRVRKHFSIIIISFYMIATLY